MKNLIKLPAIVLGLMLLMTGTTQRVMAQDEDVSLQSFYDELSPYGTWIQDPEYGYVWRPDVEQGDFRPYYSNGRWAMTEYGNTWVSNYDWGWAPFHYGRWVYNRYRQWIWIPDTVWGPAWVSWRSGGGYYGWAPLGPGLNININIGIPDNWWVFIPQRNIYYDSFPRYYSRRNVTIIHNTTIINNTYERNRRIYYTGPRVDDVRRATRQDVRIYNVSRTSRADRSGINGNNLNLYNPRVTRSERGTVQAPRNAVKGDGYVTRSERYSDNRTGDRNNNNNNNGRPDRNNTTENRNPAERPSRSDAGNNPIRGNVPANGNTPANGTNPVNNGRPSREDNRPGNVGDRNNGTNPQRPDRTATPRERQPFTPQQQTAPQQQNVPQVQPQRETRRPEQAPRQQQQQPQPQPQRTERAQPQPAPSRSSEGRSSRESGGERSSEGGRSSRGGRG